MSMVPTEEDILAIRKGKIETQFKNHMKYVRKIEQFNLRLKSIAEKYFKIKIIDFDKNEVLWDKYEVKNDNIYYSTRRISANSFVFPIKYLYQPELINELKVRTKEMSELTKARLAEIEKDKARKILAQYPELIQEYIH